MLGRQDLVSIVLPVHNGERYLRLALESCLGQSYRNLELVVVDDASRDGSTGILSAVKDPRVRVLRHDCNRGLAEALNTGFAASRGELLTWTSDDNIYRPEAVEAMAGYLFSHPKVDFVYAGYRFMDADGSPGRAGKVLDSRYLDEDNCVGSCFLYRRKVYESLGGYNPALRLAEDYEYWLRVRSRFVMRRLPQQLYYHRHHPRSLTISSGPLQVAERVHEARRPYVSVAKYAVFEARRALARGQVEAAAVSADRALASAPFSFDAWKCWLRCRLERRRAAGAGPCAG